MEKHATIPVTFVNVTVNKETRTKVRGWANIVLGDAVAIRGIQIIEGQKGFFITMPRHNKKSTGETAESVYPVHRKQHDLLELAILNEYAKKTGLELA